MYYLWINNSLGDRGLPVGSLPQLLLSGPATDARSFDSSTHRLGLALLSAYPWASTSGGPFKNRPGLSWSPKNARPLNSGSIRILSLLQRSLGPCMQARVVGHCRPGASPDEGSLRRGCGRTPGLAPRKQGSTGDIWSSNELLVYQTAGDGTIQGLASFLKKQGVNRAYGHHWLSAVIQFFGLDQKQTADLALFLPIRIILFLGEI